MFARHTYITQHWESCAREQRMLGNYRTAHKVDKILQNEMWLWDLHKKQSQKPLSTKQGPQRPFHSLPTGSESRLSRKAKHIQPGLVKIDHSVIMQSSNLLFSRRKPTNNISLQNKARPLCKNSYSTKVNVTFEKKRGLIIIWKTAAL